MPKNEGITQNELILQLLKSGKSITPMQALREFGCFRLSARIYDLKRMGYEIKMQPAVKKNKWFASYSLVSNI